jgi:hypothetical protein
LELEAASGRAGGRSAGERMNESNRYVAPRANGRSGGSLSTRAHDILASIQYAHSFANRATFPMKIFGFIPDSSGSSDNSDRNEWSDHPRYALRAE